MTDDEFARAATAEPCAALAYAAARMTDEQFSIAATAEPDTARAYASERYARLSQPSRSAPR